MILSPTSLPAPPLHHSFPSASLCQALLCPLPIRLARMSFASNLISRAYPLHGFVFNHPPSLWFSHSLCPWSLSLKLSAGPLSAICLKCLQGTFTLGFKQRKAESRSALSFLSLWYTALCWVGRDTCSEAGTGVALLVGWQNTLLWPARQGMPSE